MRDTPLSKKMIMPVKLASEPGRTLFIYSRQIESLKIKAKNNGRGLFWSIDHVMISSFFLLFFFLFVFV
jgi:hypothetical protein